MYTGLYAAVSGSLAQEKRLAILNNNLANATTVGFKADQAVFRVAELPLVVGTVTPEGFPTAVVASLDPLEGQHSPQQQLVETHTDFSQGPIRETGNPLDVALDGQGFFVVQTPDGVAYTRQGTFSINADGLLVTRAGLLVQGQQGPLNVSGGDVNIDASGEVSVGGVPQGRLRLVDFAAPYGLQKMGDSLFRTATPEVQELTPTGLGVHQRAVEASNSDPIQLLSATIVASRAYEAYQKVIQAFDETAGRAVNDLAKTT
jgi:flagellar basal-body rod protein FlgG